MRKLVGLFAWALLLAAAGCSDGPVAGDVLRNAPPNTTVSAVPPVLGTAGFEVTFNWTGEDADGRVVGFEWRISNNGEDGVVDIEDTLEVDLPWRSTTLSDSTFLVQADIDSFPPDAGDPRQRPRDYRFWQTHTFYVRAVDEKGAKDPSPAHVSFTGTTLAPTVLINLPNVSVPPDCLQGPKVLTFGWEGVDPDLVTGDPEYIRYILKPYASPSGGCITATLFDLLQPIRNNDPLWSPWIRYDALGDSGTIVTFDRQEPGSIFLFAVQARDVAGAVTPTFEWGVNVRHVQTTNSKYPLLTVTEQFLGTEAAVATNSVRSFEIAADQALNFTWIGDGSEYGGIIEAYRYGWDVTDPEDPNDPGWAVPWGSGPSWQRAPTQRFQIGAHNFVVQCRDNSGTISRLIYLLNVVQVPAYSEQRELLLVDDWREDATGGTLDPLWDGMWNNLLQGVTGFQPADFLEASAERARITFPFVVDYKSVIWFTNASGQSVWTTTLSPVSRLVMRFNWMEIYQARIGNLLMVGPGVLGNTVADGENYIYPIVFNVPIGPPLGMGQYRDVDGTLKNRGTLRFPYRSFCLELIDQVRPPLGRIFGEENAGVQVRSVACDGLHTAELDTNFVNLFPDTETEYGMGQLRPNSARLATTPGYQFQVEEIYNRNTTTRAVSLVARPCQVTMYRWRARRDMGAGPTNPAQNCFPRNRTNSTVDNSPCAVASQVYSASKPVRGASDFVWGFHPMGFNTSDVQRSLRWMLRSNWGLDVQ